ncbi:MAG TPA: glycosyltransferase, partial [Nitrospirales bacterium]|nr:glycosyltransferase [Nitrospirales bacterium]
FQPDRIAGQTIRKEWGISDHEKLIGLVARLDPMKDHLTFIQAAAELSKLRDDVRFVCVGTGPSRYQQKLQAMSKQLDVHSRLIWDGPRLDMPAVYNAFDLACSSSSWGEGFANAIGEAMASGVPCVATDVGDSAVIVGDIGVIVPPQDPKSLALAWSDMLCKEDMITGTYATQARAHIVRQFGHERLFQRTAQVLEQLLT